MKHLKVEFLCESLILESKTGVLFTILCFVVVPFSAYLIAWFHSTNNLWFRKHIWSEIPDIFVWRHHYKIIIFNFVSLFEKMVVYLFLDLKVLMRILMTIKQPLNYRCEVATPFFCWFKPQIVPYFVLLISLSWV